MKKIAIIGAGISGLFIANLLKKKPNYQITIYEKNTSINLDEGYGVQLSVNSIKLLNEIGFEKLHNNEKFTPEKINFYSNKSLDKICELDITEFNSEDCKYTTLKRSSLINFLKTDLEGLIMTDYNISKIDQQDKKIKLSFENAEVKECDYLIISDGIFSKSKSLMSKDEAKPKYNNTLAIRGILNKSPENIDSKNIALFLGSDFHHVVYPVNAHETLIWASKSEKSKYTFNYQSLKCLNDDLQMRSNWDLPICNGTERLKKNGKKIHSTQKPEALLHRILLATSNKNDLVLDPFLGSGTTPTVAKKLGRNYYGIEKEKAYFKAAEQRLRKAKPIEDDYLDTLKNGRSKPRIPFGSLVELGIIKPGTTIFDNKKKISAKIMADGSIKHAQTEGSIHKVAATILGAESCNGWTYWHYNLDGAVVPIDHLRQKLISKN